MDIEVAGLAITLTALLSGLVTRLIVKPESPVLTGQLQTVDSAHVHEAVSVDATGWRCSCGLHFHRYIHGVCVCGQEGKVDAWPTT